MRNVGKSGKFIIGYVYSGWHVKMIKGKKVRTWHAKTKAKVLKIRDYFKSKGWKDTSMK